MIRYMNNEIKGKRLGKQLPILVTMLGPGELFGDYEAFHKFDFHEFTLECRSIKGEILILEKAEFAKKVGIIPMAIKNITEKSKEKRYLYYRQVLNSKTVHHKNHSVSF